MTRLLTCKISSSSQNWMSSSQLISSTSQFWTISPCLSLLSSLSQLITTRRRVFNWQPSPRKLQKSQSRTTLHRLTGTVLWHWVWPLLLSTCTRDAKLPKPTLRKSTCVKIPGNASPSKRTSSSKRKRLTVWLACKPQLTRSSYATSRR